MALGTTALNKVMSMQSDIDKCIGNDPNYGGMKNSLNSFEYVSSNLNVWADETTIGMELRKDLNTLSESLSQLISNTETLNTSITNFVTRQQKINQGR